ncbi:MAG: hypothetical protein ACXAC0_03380 [Candidatus Thorarchaeota archaeon]
MSKLEEVSSKHIVLIDSFDAKMNHLQVLAFSLFISAVYSSYLWFICSTVPGIISGLLLFGSQIAIGFPATRTYYDFGVTNREKLHFIDPPTFNTTGRIHEVDIHLGEIPLIFEKLDIQIGKYDDGSLDDLSDLAWFGVLVWAAISSTSFYFGIGGYPLCLFSALVLILACFGSYLSGYWTRRNFGFEDDLSHLQYFVEKRFKTVDALISESRYRIFVKVLERWRSLILMDFSIEIKLGDDSALEYHIGFPSTEKEQIVVKATNGILNSVYDGSNGSQILTENNWCAERIETPAGPIVRVINESSDFSVTTRSSFVISPSIVDESSKKSADAFLEVLSFTNRK